MISSQNALLFAYAFYLLGRVRYAVPEHVLQKTIGRWFFAISLTGRYTNSPESAMDADLNRIGNAKTSEDFIRILDEMLASDLTNDYWRISLPAIMESSSARNPGLFGFVAAQNRLNAPVLFSHKRIPELLDPALTMRKKALERHHLFPRAWLEREGEQDLKRINQIANYAMLEWPDNISISDDAPSEYVPVVRQRFTDDEWQTMCGLHALPANWETLPYDQFLQVRRELMADIIRRGYETLR
jgi:hypothetical protein